MASSMLAYLNGRFVWQEEAYLPHHDAGFVFGATVTEFCRTFGGRLFRLPDHVRRLRESCELARIPLRDPEHEIALFAEELVAKNDYWRHGPGQELALVVFATPGSIRFYAGCERDSEDSPATQGPPTLGMHTFLLPLSRYASLFRQGAHLVVPTTRQVPPSSVDPRIKHRSRLHWWIAGQEAQQTEKDAWALLLDTSGYVTETAAANFLIVKDGIVYTPPRTMILGGISLRTVEEVSQEMGISLEERQISVEDCLAADEAMLTGTSFCLAGVSRINGAAIPWPGKVFERLLEAWSKRVGLDIRAQILSGG